MKQKNGFFLGLILIGFTSTFTAHAIVFPDQEVTSAQDQENENMDAVSRFGSNEDPNKSRNELRLKSLDPISDSSFEGGVAAAPTRGSGRGPAGVVEKAHSAPKSAIIREAQKKKLYQEVAVIANDLGFYPSTLFITEGIPVRMYVTGASAKAQCFMLDQFGVRRQVRSQKIEEVTFVPDRAGTFTFRCPMNGAKGTIVVKELEIGAMPTRTLASEAQE